MIALSSPLLLASAFLFLWDPPTTLPPPDQTPPVAATRARQLAVKTLDVEVRYTETIPRGGIRWSSPVPLASGPILPIEETIFQSVNRLVLHGVKYRVEDNHPTHSPQAGRLIPIHDSRLYTFDGVTSKFMIRSGSPTGRTMGVIQTPLRAMEGKLNSHFSPLALTLGGQDPTWCSTSLVSLTPTRETLRIEDAVCHEFTLRSADGTHSLWMDPMRDYVVRRHVILRSGGAKVQYDISYHPHSVCGWIPVSWTWGYVSGDGMASWTHRGEVIRLRVNEPLSEDVFQGTFPTGSMVVDQGTNKEYRVDEGGNLVLVWSPMGKGGPRPTPLEEAIPGWPVWIGLGVCGLVFLLIVLHLRRRILSNWA